MYNSNTVKENNNTCNSKQNITKQNRVIYQGTEENRGRSMKQSIPNGVN
jgi:hypothetical protein